MDERSRGQIKDTVPATAIVMYEIKTWLEVSHRGKVFGESDTIPSYCMSLLAGVERNDLKRHMNVEKG